MLLADVMPVERPELTVPPVPKLDELKAKIADIKKVKSYAQELNFGGTEEATLTRMEHSFAETYVSERRTFFGEHLTLPEEHVNREVAEIYSVAMAAPKVKLSGVRTIADRLGFVVMPFAYMDPRAYEKDKAAAVVKNFADKLGKSTQVYALSPVQFYSAEQHAKAVLDAEIYAPDMMSQAFMAINMVMPLFRSMANDMDNMKKNFTSELKNLGKRVDDLQALVNKHIKDQIEARARQEAENERLREAARMRDFRMYDPILIAVPAGASVRTSDAYAIMGPCWGPDAPDILFEAVNLMKVDGQRAELMDFQKKWEPRLPANAGSAVGAARPMDVAPSFFQKMEEDIPF